MLKKEKKRKLKKQQNNFNSVIKYLKPLIFKINGFFYAFTLLLFEVIVKSSAVQDII